MTTLKYHILQIALAILSLSCSNKKGTMIHIQFDEEKPAFYGYTGLHLYGTRAEKNGSEAIFNISKSAKHVNLYKLYNDLAIFLSNNTKPTTTDNDIRLFAVYGNPQHLNSISQKSKDDEAHHIVGYLNQDDIKALASFLSSNQLDDQAAVQAYFDRLDEPVKEELTLLLSEDAVSELHEYLKEVVTFFQECAQTELEVAIIYYP